MSNDLDRLTIRSGLIANRGTLNVPQPGGERSKQRLSPLFPTLRKGMENLHTRMVNKMETAGDFRCGTSYFFWVSGHQGCEYKDARPNFYVVCGTGLFLASLTLYFKLRTSPRRDEGTVQAPSIVCEHGFWRTPILYLRLQLLPTIHDPSGPLVPPTTSQHPISLSRRLTSGITPQIRR